MGTSHFFVKNKMQKVYFVIDTIFLGEYNILNEMENIYLNC